MISLNAFLYQIPCIHISHTSASNVKFIQRYISKSEQLRKMEHGNKSNNMIHFLTIIMIKIKV